MSVVLRPIQSRQTSIAQLPTSDNAFTLVVEFDDGPISDSFHYVVEVDVTPLPTFAAFAARAALHSKGPCCRSPSLFISARITAPRRSTRWTLPRARGPEDEPEPGHTSAPCFRRESAALKKR